MNSYGGAVVSSLTGTAGTRPQIAFWDYTGTQLTTAFWLVGEWESAAVSQQGTDSMTTNYQGDVVAVHFSGDYYEATVRMKPFAEWVTDNATTITNTLKSAHVIRRGFTAAITGMPVIAAGVFTSATGGIWNVGGSGVGANRWIVYSDGLDMSNAGVAGKNITLRRFPNIVATTAAIIS